MDRAVGVDRPREKGGIEIGSGSNGGAVYLMRKVGTQGRLLAMVRRWGSSWILSFAGATTFDRAHHCLLYTSDAADDPLCVDLGGRRIIKKKKQNTHEQLTSAITTTHFTLT